MNYLADEAKQLLAELTPQTDRATLVTLSGELGAGKTTLVQQLAAHLGVREPVTSPTFVLAKVYTLPEGPYERLVHIDAYRLSSGNELTPLGFSKLMEDPKNLIVLEWPEQVKDTLPVSDRALHIELAADGTRAVTEMAGRV